MVSILKEGITNREIRSQGDTFKSQGWIIKSKVISKNHLVWGLMSQLQYRNEYQNFIASNFEFQFSKKIKYHFRYADFACLFVSLFCFGFFFVCFSNQVTAWSERQYLFCKLYSCKFLPFVMAVIIYWNILLQQGLTHRETPFVIDTISVSK